MRMLLRWEIGLEAGNEAIRTGRIAELGRAFMMRGATVDFIAVLDADEIQHGPAEVAKG